MLSNGFINESIIASKSGAVLDQRQIMTPQRTKATTYGERYFNNLTGWTTSPSGVSVTPSGSPDPAIGNTVCFQTGATLSAPAFVQQRFATVPQSFGVAIFPALVNVGTNLADALLLQVQKTTSQRNLQVRFTMSGMFVFLDGLWKQISTHGNTSWCEWWIEVAEVNGKDVITVYAGTQRLNSLTGLLPNGPAGNGGLVYIGQESSATSNRKSQVAYLAIGETQLFGDMSFTTTPYSLVVESKTLSGLLLVEDVATGLVANADLSLELSVNGGAFEPVTLVDKGTLCNGVIDSTKALKIFAGTITKSCSKGAGVVARVGVKNNKFAGIHSLNVVATSTM